MRFTLNHSVLKKYIHLFFDLDRTLWDFESNSLEALNDLFEKFALKDYFISPRDFINSYHKHNERLWAQYRVGELSKDILRSKRFELTLKDGKLSDAGLARQIGDEYLELSVVKTRLFPYTVEILEYLRPRYKLYILTNGFRETQARKMKNSGLDEFFDHVFTSEALGYNKPDTRIFSRAVSSVNARKKDCLMIGDDYEVDITGASQFGIDTVFFNPAGTEGDFKATYQITDLKGLEEFL